MQFNNVTEIQLKKAIIQISILLLKVLYFSRKNISVCNLKQCPTFSDIFPVVQETQLRNNFVINVEVPFIVSPHILQYPSLSKIRISIFSVHFYFFIVMQWYKKHSSEFQNNFVINVEVSIIVVHHCPKLELAFFLYIFIFSLSSHDCCTKYDLSVIYIILFLNYFF